MKFKKLAVLFAAVMALSGCSEEEAKTDMSKLPPDTPYCRNIMETENGYYYNVDMTLSLRYTEKSSGNDIFLCPKPECMHDGNDSCTATYNNLIVSEPVLYNGYIYFIGEIRTKETAGYSLYKVALDGSSLDKVTDIVEAKKPPQYGNFVSSLQSFIIHKGYAYVPYTVGQGDYTQFVESGFARVDIVTGETEFVSRSDNWLESGQFSVYAGCGDYVFYDLYSHSSLGGESGTYVYNIETGESKLMLEHVGDRAISCFGDDTFYYINFNEENELILSGYDIESLEPNDITIETGETSIGGVVLCYEDKLFLRGAENIKVLSKEGDLLGTVKSMGVDSDEMLDGSNYYNGSIFDISDGKLYTSVTLDDWNGESEIYCCNIDDILNGTAEWEKAYTKHTWEEYWDEDPVMKVLQEGESE